MTSLSAYEEQRRQNITRNNKKLEALGLLDLPHELKGFAESEQSKSASNRPKRTRNSRDIITKAPVRASRRLRGQDVDGKKLHKPITSPAPGSVSDAVLPMWAETLFYQHQQLISTQLNQPVKKKRKTSSRKLLNKSRLAEVSSKQTKSNGTRGSDTTGTFTSAGFRWNPRQTHQHLKVSSDGLLVATVGCAGYGNSLAHDVLSTKKNSGCTLCFSVKVERLGIGGFAVGIVSRKDFKKPFKSVGKRVPQSVMFHSDGSLWYDSMQHEGWGPEYDQHDHVTVKLTASGTLIIGINDDTVGQEVDLSDTVKKKGFKGFIPVVQPYMGGAARLI